MTTPFDSFTLELAEKLIGKRFDEDAQEVIDFYNGDHWRDGKGWIGPEHEKDHVLYKSTMSKIAKTFISHNVIAEGVQRHVSGVLARDLHWKLIVNRVIPQVPKIDPLTGEPMTDIATGQPIMEDGVPTDEENRLIEEAQLALVEWWNEKGCLETLKQATAGFSLARRATLRLSIPPGLRDEQGNLPPTSDLTEALSYIYLDHMGFDEDSLKQIIPSATVYTDKNSRKEIGIFVSQETLLDDTLGPKRVELTYLEEDGSTVFRVIEEARASQPQEGQATLPTQANFNLGGRLLMYEMRREPLITKALISQQKSLNKTLTMMDRNNTQAGFLERYLINTKWPTKEVKNPATGEITYEPAPMFTGPGTLNALQGETYLDEMGVTKVMEPKVQFRDPVSSETFIQSSDHTYLGMLKEMKQLHYSIANESVVSGESRKQARDAFTKDLQSSGNVIEGGARWGLETALALASVIINAPGRYEGLRAYVEAHIDPGPVSADDLRAAAEMIDRGVWDWEYGVSQTGVDDVDAMKQRLEKERQVNEARTLAMMEEEPEDEDNSGDSGENEEEEESPLAARRNGAR